jgi:hypothetical protein
MAPFWPTLEALVGHSNSRHSDGTTSRKSGDYHPAGDYLSPK